MRLNDALIPHYRSRMVPFEELKNRVAINESLLKEKPTWYEINGKLNYFKVRNDFRLFSEFFFSMFASKIMELQSLEYHLAYVRTEMPKVSQDCEQTKCGLLSANFQNPNYNHYLVSELMHPEISDFVAYGGYNLKSLLSFFKDYLAYDEYTANELFLIKLFISDAFMIQVDRNPNNIAFQIPAVDNVSFTDRLRPKKIANLKCGVTVHDNERDIDLLTGFMPNVVFDSERILGIDHKDVLTYKKGELWIPLFPYDDNVDFLNMKENEIEQVQKDFCGLDPNLMSLYSDYPTICKPLLDRLAYDDEYRKILEEFNAEDCPIVLSNGDLDYINMVLKDRQEAFKRILSF